MTSKSEIQGKIEQLVRAHKEGKLGDQTMPEDTHPEFSNDEQRRVFFTLPMALNYQRDSYKLWCSARETFLDDDVKLVFDIKFAANADMGTLRQMLTKHKLALQPNNHVAIWQKISQVVNENWGTIGGLLDVADYDFVKLQKIVQNDHKKQFPYLSGPKIFHYWCKILGDYCNEELKNRHLIQIAPDTHVIQCAVKLGIMSDEEAKMLSRDDISERFRDILADTGIAPIDLHEPLWFWSKNNFEYRIT